MCKSRNLSRSAWIVFSNFRRLHWSLKTCFKAPLIRGYTCPDSANSFFQRSTSSWGCVYVSVYGFWLLFSKKIPINILWTSRCAEAETHRWASSPAAASCSRWRRGPAGRAARWPARCRSPPPAPCPAGWWPPGGGAPGSLAHCLQGEGGERHEKHDKGLYMRANHQGTSNLRDAPFRVNMELCTAGRSPETQTNIWIYIYNLPKAHLPIAHLL